MIGTRRKQLQQILDDADAGWAYPWDGLTLPIRVVGYGSLLEPTSAAKTITGTPEAGHPPVWVYGARRTYTYRSPRWRDQEGGPWTALNAEHSGRVGDGFNGRVFELTEADLQGFREREVAYDLRPVVTVDWSDREAGEPTLAYCLCATDRAWEGDVFYDGRGLPERSYHRLCRQGAARVSEAFLSLFSMTTWLGSGERLDTWERRTGWVDA